MALQVKRTGQSWGLRIRRAERLAAEDGPAGSLLAFYARLLGHQHAVYESFDRRRPVGSVDADVTLIAENGLNLVQAVAHDGPDPLVAGARALLEADRAAREDLLRTYWHERSDRLFFAKALFQPYGQWLTDAGMTRVDARSPSADNRCPSCGGAPQLSILEAGAAMSIDGASRQLLCATCLTTWPFRRVVCPSCGEEDERKLGYYRSPVIAHLRVDACESCGRYLKTIDRGQLGLAVPLVDEVAGASLDLWARQRGYEKIELNLLGL
jgi:formate dehydrogenase maturation protein FdhE